ncbi:MAG: amidohydrolase [Firmicutes bacterium]|jgi:predicted amidohydrolase|nr:amidohydrolase [Bacillota bacterium]
MHIVPSFKAAVIQFEPQLLDARANLSRLTNMLGDAARLGARLAVLPEMAATGCRIGSREAAVALAETVPGPTTQAFGEIAARLSMYVVMSLPEVDADTGAFYHAAVLLGPSGVVGKYRKVHLSPLEAAWATAGNLGLPVFETPLGRISMVLGGDAEYFESCRVPALRGADVVCLPTACPGKAPLASWRSRALENGVYLLVADAWGWQGDAVFAGWSLIVSPRGEVIASIDSGDGVAAGLLNVRDSRDKRVPAFGDLMGIRRPEEYHGVLINPYLWERPTVSGLPGSRETAVRVFQFDPEPGNPRRNAAEMAVMLEESWSESPAGIVVFPELSTTGIVDGPDMPELAETVPGPLVDRLTELAAEFDTHIAVGMVEADEYGRAYNAAVLLEPGGVVGVYRKTHLNEYDRTWATSGNLDLPCFDIPAGRVGIVLGSEILVPELARCLAKKGADIILCPSSWCWNVWDFVLHDRARTNDCYLAVAGHARGHAGRSVIIGDPGSQETAYVLGPQGWATLKVSTAGGSFCRRKEMLRGVQPVWYDAIARKRG